MVDSKVSSHSCCQRMATTILLFNVENYDESFGSAAQMKDFKATKRQCDKSGEDNRESFDYNSHSSLCNKV